MKNNPAIGSFTLGALIGIVTLLPFYMAQLTEHLSRFYVGNTAMDMFSAYTKAFIFLYQFIFIAINPFGYFIGPDQPLAITLSIFGWILVVYAYRYFRPDLNNNKFQSMILLYILLGASYHFQKTIFPFNG